MASSLSPPTLPSIHYLLPPKDLSKNLAYCSTLCQAQEWNEDNHFKLRSPEQISEDVFGQKINYEGTYSKVSLNSFTFDDYKKKYRAN